MVRAARAPTPSSCSPSATRAASTARCKLVARGRKIDVEESAVTVRVGIGPKDGGFGISVAIEAELPGLAA